MKNTKTLEVDRDAAELIHQALHTVISHRCYEVENFDKLEELAKTFEVWLGGKMEE